MPLLAMKYKDDYDEDERPKRRHYCSDRTCGGTDCHNCYPFYVEHENPDNTDSDTEDGCGDVLDKLVVSGSSRGLLREAGEGAIHSATGNQGTETQN